MNLDEAFLDEKLAELERAASWSPRIISKLETLIYVTEEVYQAPGVSELLRELHVTPRKASLKGVQRAMAVYRVARCQPRPPLKSPPERLQSAQGRIRAMRSVVGLVPGAT